MFDDPALTIHYTAEGRQLYTALLFVPSMAPFDLYDQQRDSRIKLFVKRIFITEDAKILPSYLRFARGIVDSEDIPLNLSREMLQNNPLLTSIRKAVTNKLLSELTKCANKQPDDYKKIWEAFGPVMKEGLYEDPERRDTLYELVRFKSSAKRKWPQKLKRMKTKPANGAPSKTMSPTCPKRRTPSIIWPVTIWNSSKPAHSSKAIWPAI